MVRNIVILLTCLFVACLVSCSPKTPSDSPAPAKDLPTTSNDSLEPVKDSLEPELGNNEACDGVRFKGQCAQKGATVRFGQYLQDVWQEPPIQPIEWIVLDVVPEESKLLLLSKYVLDSQPYHKRGKGITWENCYMRYWLNHEFLDTAFSSTDKESILATHQKNPNNTSMSNGGKGIPGGNDTDDRIFLLTVPDVETYLQSAKEREVKVTMYSFVNGIDVYGADENGKKLNFEPCTPDQCFTSWWTRTPGSMREKEAEYVDGDGSIRETNVTASIGVRPALWVKY